MPKELEFQKLKQDYPDFFKQFAPELLEIVFSEETFYKIADICVENGVKDEERIEKIAYRVGLVLLEEVPRENFAEIIEKGVGLNGETAKKIALEMKRLIFSQIPEVGTKKEVGKRRPFNTVAEILFGHEKKKP